MGVYDQYLLQELQRNRIGEGFQTLGLGLTQMMKQRQLQEKSEKDFETKLAGSNLAPAKPGQQADFTISGQGYTYHVPKAQRIEKALDLGFRVANPGEEGVDLYGMGQEQYIQIDPDKGVKDSIGQEIEKERQLLELKEEFKERGEKRKIKQKKKTELATQKENFQITVNLAGNMWDRFKEQIEEGGAIAGGGIKGGIRTLATALPEEIGGLESTRAFPGQRTESSLALSRVVTGQNRVVKAIFNRLAETFPDRGDSLPSAAQKIDQSVINAYGLYKARIKAGISDEALSKLTNDQANNMNSEINQIMMSLPVEPLNDEEKKEAYAIIEQILGPEDTKKYKVGRFRTRKGKDVIEEAKQRVLGQQNNKVRKFKIRRKIK